MQSLDCAKQETHATLKEVELTVNPIEQRGGKRGGEKKTIRKAKEDSLNKHINSLNPQSSPQKTWAFTKAWIKGAPASDLYSSPLKDPANNRL